MVDPLNVVPEALTQAAGSIAAIGDSWGEVSVAAAGPTTAIVPAAADEVSTALAELFSGAGQVWQELAAAAQSFEGQFVQNLLGSAQEYLRAEAVNRGAVGLGENLLRVSPTGVSTSIPVDLLLGLTNTGIPFVGPFLDNWAMAAVNGW